ncbi:MAG: DMT family transporter [Alphaproteobacteria bacterium]|nr:DMT family transporter [Alphaproteobacteria bacterium]
MFTHQKKSIGAIQLILAMILSGTVGIFATEAQSIVQTSFNVVFFRCLFGVIFMATFCVLRGYFKDTGLDKRKLILILLGGACIVFNWVLLFKSFDLITKSGAGTGGITLGTVVYHTQPFYVVLLGAFFFKETITMNKIGWIIAAFIGVVLVTDIIKFSTSSFDFNESYFQGIICSLVAAFLYGCSTIIGKGLKGVRPHITTLIQVTLGSILLFPFVTFDLVPMTIDKHWLYLGGMGLIHTCIMYVLMYSAYPKLPTPLIAVLSFIYPVMAVFFDYLIYGHTIHWLQGLGIALIILGGLGVNLNWSLKPSFSKVKNFA